MLDHVRDADFCMSEAVRITKPGGLLVIGQELSDAKDAATMQADPGQVGHPIRVDHHWMDDRLVGFESVLKKILSRDDGRGPAHHYGTYVYTGRKVIPST